MKGRKNCRKPEHYTDQKLLARNRHQTVKLVQCIAIYFSHAQSYLEVCGVQIRVRKVVRSYLKDCSVHDARHQPQNGWLHAGKEIYTIQTKTSIYMITLNISCTLVKKHWLGSANLHEGKLLHFLMCTWSCSMLTVISHYFFIRLIKIIINIMTFFILSKMSYFYNKTKKHYQQYTSEYYWVQLWLK